MKYKLQYNAIKTEWDLIEWSHMNVEGIENVRDRRIEEELLFWELGFYLTHPRYLMDVAFDWQAKKGLTIYLMIMDTLSV